jgi:hypothetical protein
MSKDVYFTGIKRPSYLTIPTYFPLLDALRVVRQDRKLGNDVEIMEGPLGHALIRPPVWYSYCTHDAACDFGIGPHVWWLGCFSW